MGQLPINFIHIGLGKCASTYLQNVFNNSSDYNVVDLNGVVSAIHENARKSHGPQQFPNINIDIDSSLNDKNKRITVASNEDFTFFSDPCDYEFVKNLVGLSSHFLGKARISDKILLMIRNPIEWLRAAHEQSIKGGRFDSFGIFFKKEKNYLRNSLNLREILDAFEMFFEIITLASEDLRVKPDKFWELYSQKLGVRKPEKELLNQILEVKYTSNSSLGERSIKLAILNKFSAYKLECLNALGEYNTFMQEESRANILYCEHERWSNRRMMEFASDESIEKLMSLLSEFDAENFSQICIDVEIKDHLLKNFLEPLKRIDTVSDNLLDDYHSSIMEATKEK